MLRLVLCLMNYIENFSIWRVHILYLVENSRLNSSFDVLMIVFCKKFAIFAE